MNTKSEARAFDLVIIGGGPGGYVTAIYASRQGLSTALIESDKVGGTCLNRGCVPTKQLLHEANTIQAMNKSVQAGVIDCEFSAVNQDAIYERVFEAVSTLRGGVEGLLKINGVHVFRGTGSFKDSKTILIKGNDERIEVLHAEHVVIATGSVPTPLPGLSKLPSGVVYSDALLEKQAPSMERLIIIGGGVIGVEIATAFSQFGVKVRVIEACDQLLPQLDSDIASLLCGSLRDSGIDVHVGAKVISVEKVIGCVRVGCDVDGERFYYESDLVLVAIGRRPNTAGLCFENAGLSLTRGGFAVDGVGETEVKGIYAIGDVTTGSVQLAHAASAQGMIAVDHILGNTSDQPCELLVPSCIYTTPEVAVVGLNERSAHDHEIDVVVSTFPALANSMSVITRDTSGFIRVLSEKESGVIVGAQLVCGRATDLIAELTLAIKNRLTLKEIADTIHPHPSFCEAVFEASSLPLGRAIHIAPGRTK